MLKEILNENNIKIVVDKDGKEILIPHKILLEELEVRENGQDSIIKEFINTCCILETIQNQINDYLWKGENDINIIINNIIEVKKSNMFDKVKKHIDISLDDIENKLLNVFLAIENDEERLEEYKRNIKSNYIENEKKVNLIVDDEYLDNIFNDINCKIENNRSQIEESDEPNEDYNPILVIDYEKKIYGYFNEFNESMDKVKNIYLERQPLKGIINNNEFEGNKLIYIILDEGLSDLELNEIRVEAIVRYKPKNIKRNQLKENKRWGTLSQVKKQLNLDDNIRSKQLIKKLDAVGRKDSYTLLSINENKSEALFKINDLMYALEYDSNIRNYKEV